MFIPSTFKRPVSSWKALNLRKTLLMASSVRLKPLNCSRLPCVYAQETLTDRKSGFSRNAETDLVCRLLLEKKKQKDQRNPFRSNSIAADITTHCVCDHRPPLLYARSPR